MASKQKGTVKVEYPKAKKQAEANALAKFVLAPSTNAASTSMPFLQAYGDLEFISLAAELDTSIRLVQGGDLKECEAMLMGQSHALQALFMNLTRRASMNMGQHLGATESYLRLALKAQSQCRATLETLATLKNPPVVFARQANIANGPQQVNNGAPPPSPAREPKTSSNELMEAHDAEWMDTGTKGKTGGSDSKVEAMGAIHRPTNG